jgi:hypothetical protein
MIENIMAVLVAIFLPFAAFATAITIAILFTIYLVVFLWQAIGASDA